MDPFSLLASGAHFGKRKQRPEAARQPTSHTVAPELPEHQQQQQQPSKKRKKQQQQAAATANGDQQVVGDVAGFSLFGGSLQQPQQQQQREPELPQVHTRDPQEEANVIRKALKIKVSCPGLRDHAVMLPLQLCLLKADSL